MEVLSKLFERTVPLDLYLRSCDTPPVFMKCSGGISRTTAIQKQIKPAISVELSHIMTSSSRSSTNASIIDKIEVYINDRHDNDYDAETLIDMLESLHNTSSSLFIDITGMGVRLLAILLSNLSFLYDSHTPLPFKRVYCGYTEPDSYFRNDISNIFGSGPNLNEDAPAKNGEPQGFKLYKSFDPLGPIPNFTSLGSNDMTNQLWIVLLGFEGNRPRWLLNELSRIDEIIALVTVPALKPGWSNFAFEENAHFLRGIDNDRPVIRYISAASPFSVYNFLCDCQEKYHEYRLQISPLGTKANSLGALLYALNNPYCSLVFDNPSEDSRQEENQSNKVHVYEITEALKYHRI